MIRLIVAIPQYSIYDNLPDLQKQVISEHFCEYVQPMPGTQPYQSKILIDVLSTSFHSEFFATVFPEWQVIGAYQFDGSAIVEVTPEVLMPYMQDLPVYNDLMQRIGSSAPVFCDTHSWSGWPVCWGDL